MTLAARLRAALAAPTEAEFLTGDIDAERPGRRAAASVLVAVTDRLAPGVILTQRTDGLRSHPGQVAFPGGRVDPEDSDIVAAALREAEEEIGLPRELPEIVGLGDHFRTWTGFDITPVVAVVPPDVPLAPHEAEVAAIFEVPLAWLVDAGNHAERTARFENRERRYFEMMWGERRIWGVTAAMIVNLARRLRFAVP